MTRLILFFCASAACAGLSCGGKTGLLDDTDPSGGAAGIGGSAGSAAGASGSSGRGGAAGGSGATGSGGTLGNGGIGGSAGTGGTGSVSRIEVACKIASATPGCFPGGGCEDFMATAATAAANYACEAEFNAVIDCNIAANSLCGTGTGPPPTIDCTPALKHLRQCYDQSPTCSRSASSDGACSVDCSTWSAECRPTPQGVSCFCSRGNLTGREVPRAEACASPSWLSTLRNNCDDALLI